MPAGPVITPDAPNTVTAPEPLPQCSREEACFPLKRYIDSGHTLHHAEKACLQERMEPSHKTDRNERKAEMVGWELLMVLESLVPVLGIPRAGPVQGGLSSLGVLSWDLSKKIALWV